MQEWTSKNVFTDYRLILILKKKKKKTQCKNVRGTTGNILSHLNFVLYLALFLCSTYNALKVCVDEWASVSWCRGHGFLVDEVFLEVHKMYFKLCGQVHDPPLTTLIMLIAPVLIATLFLPILCVTLTTWDTEMPSTLGLWYAGLTKENCRIFQPGTYSDSGSC